MRHRYTFDSRRHRPWLLLGLLPYLFFCIASDGLHHHTLDGFESNSTSVAAQTPPGHATQPAVSASQAKSPVECFSCQWEAQSAASLAAPLSSLLRTSGAAPAPPPRVAALSSLALTHRNRGPPLS